jgi:transposase
VQEQLRHSPHLWGVPRSRWTLRWLSVLCPALFCLSPSGVWRRLRKWKVAWKRTRNHITSPDLHYRQKVEWLKRVQHAAARGEIVLLYGDEHTYYRQPLAGQVWHQQGGGGQGQPQCVRHISSDTKRRTIAALNAQSGQITWHGCSRSTVKELCLFLRLVRRTYGEARVVLVWDNWPVHLHWRVLECAAQERIELVWLPTYAPWLNPIEKMWKWLKSEVLVAHRYSASWSQLRQHVEDFLNRFHRPSRSLLCYCGLLAD